MLSLGPEVLRDPARASRLEWLLTDGLGGYASSSVLGINTRRYHGLLVAATRPPTGRMVLLSKLDEVLVIEGQRFDLATNNYRPGVVHPRGFEQAIAFTLDPLPTLTFEAGGARLIRTVARSSQEPGTAILYVYEGPVPATLELRPLLAYRSHHALQHENDVLSPGVEQDGEDLVFRPYPGCPPLFLRVPGATFAGDGHWYRRFEYHREQERGHDFEEDLFSPGVFSVELRPVGGTASVLAWARPIPPGREAASLVAAERQRLRERGSGTGLVPTLDRAADAFLVRRENGELAIVAGYHWLAESVRDGLIAFSGLTVATGRLEEARRILARYASFLSAMTVPPDSPSEVGQALLARSDAGLWLAIATQRLLAATSDVRFVRAHVLPGLFAILDAHYSGTVSTPGTDRDGLVGPFPGAPDEIRNGQLVETQALWYNALLIGSELARLDGDSERASEWMALASQVRASVLRRYWCEEVGYLADALQDGIPDPTLAPFQLAAIGLPHALLPRDKAVRLLDAVRRELLTPVGLRDVASGPGRQTARPFWMGLYFDALVRVFGEDGKREAREWLHGFGTRLEDRGLGFVSECFSADPPYAPGGAIAHAVSVAELLRVAARLPQRPPSVRRP